MEIAIQIPAQLGLSEAQQRQLQDRFRNVIVETLSAAEVDVAAARKAQVVQKAEQVDSIIQVVVR